MARSWKDVKAEKARRDQAAGRDGELARDEARTRTQAYVLGFRLAQLHEQQGLSQSEVAARRSISQPRVSQLERGDVDRIVGDTPQRGRPDRRHHLTPPPPGTPKGGLR